MSIRSKCINAFSMENDLRVSTGLSFFFYFFPPFYLSFRIRFLFKCHIYQNQAKKIPPRYFILLIRFDVKNFLTEFIMTNCNTRLELIPVTFFFIVTLYASIKTVYIFLTIAKIKYLRGHVFFRMKFEVFNDSYDSWY